MRTSCGQWLDSLLASPRSPVMLHWHYYICAEISHTLGRQSSWAQGVQSAFLLNFLPKYHILTGKSTHSKMSNSKVFSKCIILFWALGSNKTTLLSPRVTFGPFQWLSPSRNFSPESWWCRLEHFGLFLYSMLTRSCPVHSWLSGFSCQWCECEIHLHCAGCGLFVLTVG